MTIDLPAFPKIFTIGQPYVTDIFKDEVEVTEKVDGSSLTFGRVGSELRIRSKGQELFEGAVQPMFKAGWDYVQSIAHRVPDESVFYCEYLQKPKHNTLAYERVPKNNLMLFGTSTPSGSFSGDYDSMRWWAEHFGIDVAPKLYIGKIDTVESLRALLELDSFLGGTKIEGVVVKNYRRTMLIGDVPLPIMSGKFVSEAFKEKHQHSWDREHKAKGHWEGFVESYRTEARWEKAIQHLRDDGRLTESPKDIGPLIKEVQRDITEEEADRIKAVLWREFGADLLRKSTAGLADFYKARLAEGAFE